MVKDISKFELKIENAKEYFFLNDCKMSFIDHNGLSNSNKFRNFGFSNLTLSKWTNEWMKPKINEAIINNDVDILISFLEDYSDKIDVNNSLLLIKLYNNLQHKNILSKENEMCILYHREEPIFLDKKFEYGLIYIAHNNKLLIEQKILFERFLSINSMTDKYDAEFLTKIKKNLNI